MVLTNDGWPIARRVAVGLPLRIDDCLDEQLDLPVEAIEPPVHLDESPVDRFEPSVHPLEPSVD